MAVQLMTPSEVARRLAVPVQVVEEAIRKLDLRPVARADSIPVYDREAFEALSRVCVGRES